MIKTIGAISSVLQNSIDGNSRKGSDAAEAPDLEGADQGLRWWIAGGGQPQCNNATGVFAGNPAIQLSLQGSKSFTWVETSRHRDKDPNPTTGATGAFDFQAMTDAPSIY
jgi:hypothetical protein